MEIIPDRPKHPEAGEVYWWALEGDRMRYPFDGGDTYNKTGQYKGVDGVLTTVHGFVLVHVSIEWNQIYCRFIHRKREYSMVIPGTPKRDEAEKIAGEWVEQIVSGVYDSKKYRFDNQCQCED